MFRKFSLIVVIFLLILLFFLAVWLVGNKMEMTANHIHQAMVEEVGQYRSELIRKDFKRTEQLRKSVLDILEQKAYGREELSGLLANLIRLDAKLSRVWFVTANEEGVCVDSNGVKQIDLRAVERWKALADSLQLLGGSGLYTQNGVTYWTMCSRQGNVVIGFDIALSALHAYYAGMRPMVRSYAYITNQEGVLILHPDEKRMGQGITDIEELENIHRVITENRNIQLPRFSRFLLLPVERGYYPITVGNENWVVVVNVLQLDYQEEMEIFRHYSLMVILGTVIVLGGMLILFQYKWRKEYDLRKKIERETLELNLQQLKNQLNPHFLFNSLNSLSALISQDSTLAKEFVLNLSKVYRYVLEKRYESLATVHEELEFVSRYYFLQKIRFSDQLNMEIVAGTDEIEGKIPAMSLQLLVENAVKHNEITRQHPLFIRIYVKDKQLVLENTYRPRSDEEAESIGIGFENIKKIYEFYDQKQEFSFYIEDNKFVCVLPLVIS